MNLRNWAFQIHRDNLTEARVDNNFILVEHIYKCDKLKL